MDTRVIALEVGFIVVQRGFHHLEAEHLIRVLVETAHNAGHVDALFIRLQTDRSGDRGLECQIAAVTCMESHWQAKIRNPNVLDLLFRTADQAGRAVLQIRQRRFIIIADRKITGIVTVELRIAFDVLQQFGERRIQRFYLDRIGLARPGPQRIKCCNRVITVRYHCRGDIHGRALSQDIPYISENGGFTNVPSSGTGKAPAASLQCVQCLVDVGDQIIHVLKPG